jgi:tetratricopeptide (TPR) repeat protein
MDTFGLGRLNVAKECMEAASNTSTTSSLLAALKGLAQYIREDSAAHIIDSIVYFQACQRLYHNEDFPAAVQQMDRALAINPIYADAYKYKAIALQCLNQHDGLY